jgi:hypothetical protein
MYRYVLTNLHAATSEPDQARLIARLRAISGVNSVRIDLGRKELSFEVVGAELSQNLIKELCTEAGFAFGIKL